MTEELNCGKCRDNYRSKCINCNTTVARSRRPLPRDPDPWNREPPMATCSICRVVACSTCREQSRCSNCLNDYCATCSSMKICSECDQKFCTTCTRSKFWICFSFLLLLLHQFPCMRLDLIDETYTYSFPLFIIETNALNNHNHCTPCKVSSCGACGDQYCDTPGCENSHFQHCVSSSFRRSAFNWRRSWHILFSHQQLSPLSSIACTRL